MYKVDNVYRTAGVTADHYKIYIVITSSALMNFVDRTNKHLFLHPNFIKF